MKAAGMFLIVAGHVTGEPVIFLTPLHAVWRRVLHVRHCVHAGTSEPSGAAGRDESHVELMLVGVVAAVKSLRSGPLPLAGEGSSATTSVPAWPQRLRGLLPGQPHHLVHRYVHSRHPAVGGVSLGLHVRPSLRLVDGIGGRRDRHPPARLADSRPLCGLHDETPRRCPSQAGHSPISGHELRK